MIEIHCNPARVEKILFVAGSELEEDFDHAAWLKIRPLVNQIDRRLRAMVESTLRDDAKGLASPRPRRASQ